MKRKTKPKMERRWVVLELWDDEWDAYPSLYRERSDAETRQSDSAADVVIVRAVMVPKVTR